MIEIEEARAGHIFRDAPGHLLDTPENRRLLWETANDPAHRLGRDRYGNVWYARLLDIDSQVWVQVRGDKIHNGGLNRPPRSYNPETGFSARERPRGTDG